MLKIFAGEKNSTFALKIVRNLERVAKYRDNNKGISRDVFVQFSNRALFIYVYADNWMINIRRTTVGYAHKLYFSFSTTRHIGSLVWKVRASRDSTILLIHSLLALYYSYFRVRIALLWCAISIHYFTDRSLRETEKSTNSCSCSLYTFSHGKSRVRVKIVFLLFFSRNKYKKKAQTVINMCFEWNGRQ